MSEQSAWGLQGRTSGRHASRDDSWAATALPRRTVGPAYALADARRGRDDAGVQSTGKTQDFAGPQYVTNTARRLLCLPISSARSPLPTPPASLPTVCAPAVS